MEFTIGSIIRGKWHIIYINEETIRFQCLDCGYVYEGDYEFLRRKNSCKGCNTLKYNYLIGYTFERLTVLRILDERVENGGHILAECQCICGNIAVVPISRLKSGSTRSCGCLEAEGNNYTHRLSNTRLYNIWIGIKTRCYNKNHANYQKYGARGVIMCDEWYNDFMSFYHWSINNGYNDTLTIERIDPTGIYEPSNCKWIPFEEQHYNKRNTVRIMHYGLKTVRDIALMYNIEPRTVRDHHKKGDLDAYLKKKEGIVISDLSRQLRNNK